MKLIPKAMILGAALGVISTSAWAKTAGTPSQERQLAAACDNIQKMSREQLLDALNKAVATGVEGWPKSDTFCLDGQRPVSRLQKKRKVSPPEDM